ncbi:tRNA pseudouridine synthase D [Oesophagostomum dentatum]|uniref:tRNA pseudouridine synthase D n=1 Tax=Oesophagostomum dentatum TaxID=61180 RepID=A0A0B1RWU6_OESDE|nr:tRNA pseudouridine synthase D [Oesophagostomum dentatum]
MVSKIVVRCYILLNGLQHSPFKERIISLNPRLRDIVVYDFSYQDQELKMGGHWGNRFSIILRNIPPDTQTVLEDRLKELQKDGFINYFGTQRFGSCDTNTASVGKLILRRDWEGAVRLILSNEHLPGYLGTVGDAVRCWEKTGDASQALKQLKGSQAFASIEAIIFKCLAKGGTWQKCITEALPINLRSLYVHAYQSLLWNTVVSRRVAEKGTAVMPDDLGKDGKKLPEGATIFDVYVPLPGENANYERNYMCDWYEEMLKEDNLTNSSLSSLEDRFALGETTRAMLICPKGRAVEIYEIFGTKGTLTAIDESKMVGDLMALQVQFSLPSGCYATVALRQITGTDMGKRSMKIHSESARNAGSRVDEADGVEDGVESGCAALLDAGVSENLAEDDNKNKEELSEDVSEEAGEPNCKMKIHVKNRADGNTIHLEVGTKCTVGELRTKICSELGHQSDPRGIRLCMGEEEVTGDDATSLNDAGIVSGDMLFLEMGASTSAPAQNAQSPTNESPKKEQEVEMEQDDDSDASVMFRDRVVRAARDYMEDSGYSNTSLQTWNSSNSSGAELEFERRTRNQISNIFILITALQRPSPSAIVNVGRIVGGFFFAHECL